MPSEPLNPSTYRLPGVNKMNTADEIRSKLNIVDLVSEYVKLEKKGREYKGLCPFHSEKTPSFSVSEDKQVYHCFGCQKGGDIIKFLCEYENIGYLESLEILAKRAGVSLNEKSNYKNKKAFELKKNLFEIYKQAALYYVANLYGSNKTALNYLSSRHLNKNTASAFGIGYAPDTWNSLYLHLKAKGWDDGILLKSGLFLLNKHGKITDLFRNRLMFPILDKRSSVIAFGGRVMENGKMPKYVNSPETDIFSKKNNLYGIHLAIKSKFDFFIACEGYMDVIALNHAGFDNAVASLGTALTTAQLNLIKHYTEHLYLMYDSDEAGLKAVKRAIPLASSSNLYLKIVSLNPYKDPDEFIKAEGKEKLNKRIEEAKNPIFFQADVLYEQVSINDPDSKLIFHKNLANILTDIPDKISREGYIEAAAHRYSIDYNLLKSAVDKMGYNKEIKAYNQKEKAQDFFIKKNKLNYSKAQALLLAWLVDEAKVLESIKDVIEADDFTLPLFKKAFELIRSSILSKEKIPYHLIMDGLSDEESNLMSGILTKGADFAKNEDAGLTLKELVIRIKTESYNQYKNQINNTAMQEEDKLLASKILIEKKKYIEQLKADTFAL